MNLIPRVCARAALPSRWSAAGLVLAVAAGCARPVPAPEFRAGGDDVSAESLGALDRLALRVAAAAVRAGAAPADAWPGFWEPDVAFVIRPFAGGALYVSPRSEARHAGRALAGDGTEGLRRHAVLLPDSSEPVPLDFNYRVHDGEVLAFSILTVPGMDSGFASLVLLYHESFHIYQQAAFGSLHGYGALDVVEIDGRLLAGPEFRAALAVERSVLAQALRQDTSSARAELARAYLALRAERARTLPEPVLVREDLLERAEGSAQLVGYHSALLAWQGSAAGLPEQLAENLLDPALHDPAIDRLRRHSSATGAAIGVLLDGFGAGWRSPLEAGRAFRDLLAVAVGFDATAAPALAADARQRFGYNDWLRRFEARVSDTDALAEFEAATGVRLAIIGLAPDRSSRWGRTSEAVPGTVLFRQGTRLSLRSSVASLESDGHPALEDSRTGWVSYVVLLPAVPSVNGQPPSARPTSYPTMDIAAEGLSFRVDWPVTTTWDGTTLTVTVTPGWPRTR